MRSIDDSGIADHCTGEVDVVQPPAVEQDQSVLRAGRADPRRSMEVLEALLRTGPSS